MALLPEEPKKRNGVVAIVVSLVVVGGFYQYWYTGETERIEQDRAHLETLEAANRSAQLTYARGGGNIEEQLALYERHVMKLEQLIPGQEEVSSLLRSITAEGRRVNVEIADIAPEGVRPGQFYSQTSYGMTAVGDYHDIGRFLTSIASLPRIITPVDLDLALFPNPELYADRMSNPVQANFRIETYVLPERGSGPPPADVGEGADR